MAVAPLTPEEEAFAGQTRQPALWGSLIAFLIINDLAIVGRLWGTWRSGASRTNIMFEDVFVVLSGVFVNVIIANLMAATHYGLGLHDYAVNAQDENYPYDMSHAFMHIWITMVLMSGFFTCIKLTLLFFYKRLFLVSNNWLRIFWWVNLVYVLLWFVGSTGFYLFQCRPVEWYFLQYYPRYGKTAPGGVTGECNATSVVNVSLPMIFSLISDIMLLMLPLNAIWKLNLSGRKKIGLLAVFGVGLTACLLELARILELLLDTDDKADPSFGVAIFLILTAAEETTAVVCACLPIIGPQLFKRLRSKPGNAGSGAAGYKYASSNGGPRSRRLRTDGFRRFGDDSAGHITSSSGRGNPLATNFTIDDEALVAQDGPRNLDMKLPASVDGVGTAAVYGDDVHLTTIEVAGGRAANDDPRHRSDESVENTDEIGVARAPGIYVRRDVQVVHSDIV